MNANKIGAALGTPLLVAVLVSATSSGVHTAQGGAQGSSPAGAPTLDEMRLTMGKTIEIQQIISKERKEWQQGQEILRDRVALLKKEVATLTEGIHQAEASATEAGQKRDEQKAQNDRLKATGAQLTEVVTGMEADVRRLFQSLPEFLTTKLQPLYQRIPVDPNQTQASAAERFQNVLGIMNEVNAANNDITVNYEVHALGDGKPTEVRALYVGLAQAYYVSGQGEAGVGRPAADGWHWEPAPALGADVLKAVEILQGKQTPAFVPLPVKIQ